MTTKQPTLRFPEFEGAWEEKRINDIAPLQRGFDLPTSELKKGDYPVVYSNGVLNYHYEYRVKGPGVITGRSGTIGKITYVEDNYWPHNTSLWVTNFYNNYPLFIFYFYHTVKLDKYNAGSTVPTLNRNDVHSIKKRIPSLPEQQKIAAFLTAVDKRIQLLEQKKTALEQYKKGVMQKIFSQQIRFKDDQGNDFPDWEEKKAQSIFKNYTNKKHNGDLPILSSSQEKGMIYRDNSGIQIQSSEKSILSYKIVEPGDFVISLRSFQGGIDYSDKLGICSPAYTVLKNAISIYPLFYKFYFKKERFINRLSKTTIGIRDGKQITFDAFGSLLIPVPSLPEQQKIAYFLSALDEKIATVAGQVEKMQQWKKGLLQQMFV